MGIFVLDDYASQMSKILSSWCRIIIIFAVAALAGCTCPGAAGTGRDDAWIRVRPADSGAALENPGMGWVFHHYDNSISGYGPVLGPEYNGSEFPGLTVCYLRLAWSHLEPEEGKFNWAILDEPIRRYGAAGKTFAFRFTVFEGDPKEGTPAWVRQAGAKGTLVKTYGVESWEPDYDDPVFQAKLQAFLQAAGTRYDGNPGLAFVDVGTLGIWGEGHPIARQYGLATLQRHIELHRQAFKRALLVGQDDWNRWFRDADKPETAALDLARSLGLTFRDDSLCVYPDPTSHYSAALAEPFWKDRPVILEMGHYGYAKKMKAWGDGGRYLQAVKDYHGSYVSVHANPITFLEENLDLVRRINLCVGYRLHLAEASWPASVKRTNGLAVAWQWTNIGVAPCLPGGQVALALADAQGKVAAVLVDRDWNVRDLPPDPQSAAIAATRQKHFPLPPSLKPGDYTLLISVGDADGTPRIALPLPGETGHRRYPLGKVKVEGEGKLRIKN